MLSHVIDLLRAQVAGSHLFAANDSRDHDEYPDDEREEQRDLDRMERSSRGGCQCFGPGEAGGTCPGPASCPMNGDEEGVPC